MKTEPTTIERPSTGLALSAGLLFFATGISGLIYQVVWQRYLLNVFGATIYSVSTVLAAFMGGLALGSLLFARISERTRNPLRLYGYIEIVIGAVALAIPLLLRGLDPIFHYAYANFGSNFFLFSLARFVFVFLILLLPTTLMGGTLPLLARFCSPGGQGAGLRVGALYAVNTLGAVVGCFLSGYFIIRIMGVAGTVAIAAAINVGAGIVAILLGRPIGTAPAAPAPLLEPGTGTRDRRLYFIFVAYAISGFSALGMEVAWTRGLVFSFDLLKNTTYAFTAMLTTFLVGIAIGSAVMSPFAERLRQPYRVFGLLQVLIGISGIFSMFILFYRAHEIGEQWLQDAESSSRGIRWWPAVGLVFMRTAATMFLPTFVMGLAFPVAVRAALAAGSGGRTGETVGRLYAFNTVGAILGAFLTGFVLLPVAGISGTIICLALLQMGAGIWLLTADKDTPRAVRFAWVGVAVAVLVISVLRRPGPADLVRPTEVENLVFYKEGPLATVSVIENSLGFRTIYVDNVGVAGTDPILLTDQKSLAHVPMLLLDNPKSALTVGFGSGGASYSYTLYPELERIDCIEITKTVIEASPYLVDSHRNVVFNGEPDMRMADGSAPIPLWNDSGASGWFKSDQRFNIILDDARSYLRFTDTRYDIIATDCTDLRYKSNANLYDLEYFELTRDRITDDGMVVVWMPLAGLSDEAMKVALRTFQKVFPEMEVFFMNNAPTHYILLLGKKGRVTADPELMTRRLGNEGVRRDLAEIGLASAEKILSCYVTGREPLAGHLKGDILNTPDFPYLEFESPRYGYGDDPLIDNLDGLYENVIHPRELVAEGKGTAEFMESLDSYARAVPDIIEGHRSYRLIRLVQAVEFYSKALAICPADASVKQLLEFDELRRRVRGRPFDLWARYFLGVVLYEQKRDREAVSQFNELLSAYDSLAVPGPNDGQYRRDALLRLAEIYDRNGQPEKAAESRRVAESIPQAAEGGSE